MIGNSLRSDAAFVGRRFARSLPLLGALLIAHAPLLVNDGLFGDDWLIFKLGPDYPAQTRFLIHGAGHPITYAYCALANFTGHPAAFMTGLAVFGIVAGALSLRSFLARLQMFSRFEVEFLSLLVWTYAGFQAWASKILAAYILSFGLLCIGTNLLAAIASSKRQHQMWLRLLALVVLFCSFAINSMMIVYLIALLSIAFVYLPPERDLFARLVASAKRFGDFLALPLIYWLSTNYFFPKIGPYREYYGLKDLSFTEAAFRLQEFARWSVSTPLKDAAILTEQSRWPFVVAMATGLVFVALAGRNEKSFVTPPCGGPVSALPLIVLSFVTFILFAMPYIAIGVSPGHFYESRHLVLFGVPVGLLCIAGYRIALGYLGKVAALALSTLTISIGLCALWNGYFHEQARWLRQTAMIDGLRRTYREPPAAVFNLVDGFLDYFAHTYFGASEITGALHVTWDSRPLFGFTGRHEPPTVLQDIAELAKLDGSAFRNIDPLGPQATIELVPTKPVLTNYQLSARYYRCLISRCDATQMIDSLANVAVQVGPIAGIVNPTRPRE